MGRQDTLQDISDVCALLCSDEARFFTGHALAVDGGSSLMNSDFPLALQLPGIGT
jgi:enoyl-[acyl-carrier-protein] reductase (NADH)